MGGSIHVLDERFGLVRQKLNDHEGVLRDHSEDRDCLFQEARHCHDWGQWPTAPLLEQAEYCRTEGMPEHFGRWAGGTIARRYTARMRAIGDVWSFETDRRTTRDQISLPYVLPRDDVLPATFGIDHLDNDMVALMADAEELRGYRQAVLRLETDAINATSRADDSR